MREIHNVTRDEVIGITSLMFKRMKTLTLQAFGYHLKIGSFVREPSTTHVHGLSSDFSPNTEGSFYAHDRQSDPVLFNRRGFLTKVSKWLRMAEMDDSVKQSLEKLSQIMKPRSNYKLGLMAVVEHNHIHLMIVEMPIVQKYAVIRWKNYGDMRYPNSLSRYKQMIN